MYYFFLLLFSFNSFCYQVFHQLRPGGTYDSVAMGGACTTLVNSKFSVTCNPALFATINENQLSLRLIGKADGEAVSNSKKLLSKRIEEQTLRDLFTKENFNSLSLNTNIELISNYFVLGYTPAYYLSDILLFNPALPQISMILVKRDETYITSAIKLSKILDNNWNFISLGTTLKYVSTKYINSTFTLLDVNDRDRFNQISTFNKYNGFEADLGIYVAPPTNFLPNMALVVKNLGSKYPISNLNNEEDGLEVYHVFEPRLDFGLGYPLETPIGKIDFTTVTPFSSEVDSPLEESILGARYSLDFFSINLSSGYYRQNIGFLTNTNNYSIGLIFSNEKELRGFNSDYQKSVYLSLEMVFL